MKKVKPAPLFGFQMYFISNIRFLNIRGHVTLFVLHCRKEGIPMKKNYIKYIMALLLFGTNGIVASHIPLSSCEIVLLRTFLGSLLLIAFFLFSKNHFTFLKHQKSFIFLAISGAAMGLSWMFLYEAYQQMSVSIASLCYYCGPVIVMILSPILFRESLTWVKVSGFFSVFIGICLINSTTLSDGNNLFGIFCGLMSAVMYSFMVIFNKKATRITGMENATLQLSISCLTVAVFVLFRQGPSLSIPSESLPWILFLGLVNTGIGCYLYFSSIGHLPVQSVAVIGYLEPLSAVLFSVILLHEPMTPLQIIGVIGMIGGAIWSEGVFLPDKG